MPASGDLIQAAAGGALIGLASVLLLAFNGRIMGVSGIWSNLIRASEGFGWRLAFVAGTVAAPLLVGVLRGGVEIQVDAPTPLLALAGLLVGAGTALGSGCTSGHGICGISRLSPRSITATLIFMAAGFASVAIMRHVIGGGA
ncbi:MAG: YeeE/YedE family protein [Alphaproteobacteria bacterium]|nr:MAG: YeeE/YedE family protein [Alphaproteobacteria bacterium]